MTRRWVLALIAVNLVTLVALAFAYPHLMVSPGALVPAHAALATDCFACHAPLRGAAPARCLACHALPDIGVRTTQGFALAKASVKHSFHQELTGQNCMACHSDHAGPKLAQRGRKQFSHVLLREGTRERCATCHTAPKNEFHRDLTVNCAQCHNPQGWKPASFAHDTLFLLDRDHNASCVTCHAGNDVSQYTCYGCHEHTPANISRKHQKEGIRNFDNCVLCHRSANGEQEGKGSRGAEGSRERRKRD